MHPSASANTLTLAAGQTATFTWEDNHDVWEFSSVDAYNSCNFAGAVEKASTSVKTVELSAPTSAATTKYYGCSVGSHCDDGQKIAISWTDADGCLSHEKYQCDGNCDENCSRPASKSTTPSHYSSLQATATVTRTATSATSHATKTTREIPALAGHPAVTTTATASVIRAVMRTATDPATEAATTVVRARTPTPRRLARQRPEPFSSRSRSPRCCSEHLYIPNLRRRRRPPLPPFPSPLLDRAEVSPINTTKVTEGIEVEYPKKRTRGR
jgi:hypothetical protein